MPLKVASSIVLTLLVSSVLFGATPVAVKKVSRTKTAPAIASGSSSAASTVAASPRAISTAATTSLTSSFVSSGVAGYVPKFTNSTDIGTSNMFSTGTRVGINTFTPEDNLHVFGNILLKGNVTHAIRMVGQVSAGRLGQDANGFFFAVDTPGKTMRILTTPNSGVLTDNRFVVTSDGKVGIGTNNPLNALSVLGTIESTSGGFRFPDATIQTSALPSGCSTNQIPKWSGTAWTCQADLTTVGTNGGTVTSIAAGNGLLGGVITSSGTLSVDPAVVPLLSSANAFYGNQVINGNVNATGDLNANNVGAAVAYNLAGFQVLSTNISNQNIFLGSEAGVANTIGGYGDPTSTGSSNTFLGVLAGKFNTTGSYNTLLGANTGTNFSAGKQNTVVGANAAVSAAGDNNTAVGFNSIYNNTAAQNTALGSQSGYSSTTGTGNVFLGYKAGFGNTTGSNNTFVGNVAGQTASGDSNIYIGSNVLGATESNTMRLGDPAGITTTYIAGVYNVAVSNGVPVVIDATGHVGAAAPSSRRFKEAIQPMGNLTQGLLKLHPVTFYYKRSLDPSTQRIMQYGLLAEEVAEVYPDLVTYDEEGRPNAIKYQYFTPMLLNELQKQDTVVKKQQAVIESQEERLENQDSEIRDLQKRLARMEALLVSQKRN